MSRIKFSMPVIFVANVEKSKEFYTQILGQKITMDFGENVIFENALSIWESEKARSIIFGDYSDPTVPPKKNAELYFETKKIEKTWEEIKSKDIEIIHPPKEEPWGQQVFRIHDPDGFIIEIAEPMESAIERLYDSGFSQEKIAAKTTMPAEFIKKVISGL